MLRCIYQLLGFMKFASVSSQHFACSVIPTLKHVFQRVWLFPNPVVVVVVVNRIYVDYKR